MFGSKSLLSNLFLRAVAISLIYCGMVANAAPPAWWSDGTPKVLNPDLSGIPQKNLGIANIGQAKWMVAEALRALHEKSPGIENQIRTDLKGTPVGTNPVTYPNPIVDLTVPATKTPEWMEKQRAPLLLGQLKAIAKPFYRRLNVASASWVLDQIQQNHSSAAVAGTHYWMVNDEQNNPAYYPWNPSSPVSINMSPATIGQLKAVFSLRFDTISNTQNMPTIAVASLLQATRGQAFNYTISATGTNLTFASSMLPAGLTLNSTAGTIQGIPTQAGSYPLTLAASNADGIATAVTTLVVSSGAPVITSPLTVSMPVGGQFFYQITADNDPETITASLPSPSVLTYDEDLAAVSGTMTQQGSYQFIVTAGNHGGPGGSPASDTKTVTLTVGIPLSQITSSSTCVANLGQPFSFQLAASNSPLTYSATALPPGLTLNTSTGLISGTPSALGQTSVSLKVANISGETEGYLSIMVVPAAPVLNLPDRIYLTNGVPFSFQIQSTGSPTLYSATALPTGLSVNSTTGVISGTPTAVGTPEATVNATNAAGAASKRVLFVVMSATRSSDSFVLNFKNEISPSSTYQAYAAGILTNTADSTAADSTFPAVNIGAVSSTETGRVFIGFPLSDLPQDALVAQSSLTVKGYSNVTSSSPVYPQVELLSVGAPVLWNSITWNSAASLATVLTSIGTTAPSGANNSVLNFATSSTFVAQVAAASTGASRELRLMLKAPASETLPTANRPRGFLSSHIHDIDTNARPELAIIYQTGAPPVFNLPSEWVVVKGVAQTLKVTPLNGVRLTNGINTVLPVTIVGTAPTGFSIVGGNLSAATSAAVGNYAITLNATNGNGSGARTLAVRVIDAPPVITNPAIWAFSSGVQSSFTITATNNPTSFSAEGLPEGLVLNRSTGVISGSVMTSGSSDITVRASNEAGSASANLHLDIAKTSPVITSPLTAQGTLHDNFTYFIVATQSPTSYTATGLPSGLSISGSKISGAPTQVGSFTAVLKAINAIGTGTIQLQITIAAPKPQLVNSTLQGQVGQPFDVALQFSNSPYYSPTVDSTDLPDGLSQDYWTTSDLTIVGTPTTAGVYSIPVTSENQYGETVDTLKIMILPALTLTSSLMANATVGQPLNYTVAADPSGLPSGYSVTGLPQNGLSFDSQTHTISGTPVTPGLVSVPVTVSGAHGSRIITVEINVAAKATDLAAEFQYKKLPDTGYSSLIAGIHNIPDSPISRSESLLADGTVFVGALPLNPGESVAHDFRRMLLNFDLSKLPDDIQITSATLSLHAVASACAGAQTEVAVYTPAFPFSSSSPNWKDDSNYKLTALSSRLLDPANCPEEVNLYSSSQFVAAVQGAGDRHSTLELSVAAPAAEKAATGQTTVNVDMFGFFKSGNAADTDKNPKLKVTYFLKTPTVAPEILGPYQVDAQKDQEDFSYQVKASHRPISYSISGSLPSGLSFDTTTGVISGKPGTVGDFPINVTATNAVGSSTAVIDLRVHGQTSSVDGIVIVSGTPQSGLVDKLLPDPLKVKVVKNGSPVSSVLVVFSVQPGNGAILAADGVSFVGSRAVQTNAQGEASVAFKLPGSPGQAQVSATVQSQVDGNQSSVTFTETAVLQSVNGLTDAVELRLLSVGAGSTSKSFVVQALDPLGVPLMGKTLNASNSSGPGGITPLLSGTDAQGKATFTASGLGTAGTVSSFLVKESVSQASLRITVNGDAVTGTPDSGGARGTVFDGASSFGISSFDAWPSPQESGDGTDATLSWTSSNSSASPLTFIVEWKTEGRTWQTLRTPGVGVSETTDFNVKAGRHYHYRIFAQRDGVLSKPVMTDLYMTDVLKSPEFQKSLSSVSKNCFRQYTPVVSPSKRKWYLKEAYEKNWTMPIFNLAASYSSSELKKPQRFALPGGGINWNSLNSEYAGAYHSTERDDPTDSNDHTSGNTSIQATQSPQGVWSGTKDTQDFYDGALASSTHTKITSDPVVRDHILTEANGYALQETTAVRNFQPSWNSAAVGSEKYELSNEYTTGKLIEDGNASLNAFTDWAQDSYFYSGSVGGFSGDHLKAYRYLDGALTEDGPEESYSVGLYNYRLNFNPSFSGNYKWLEVFVPQEYDQKYGSGGQTEKDRLNGLLKVVVRQANPAIKQSKTFSIDPRGSGYGRYLLMPLEGLSVGDSDTSSSFPLDENEKSHGIDIVNGQSIPFTAPTVGLPGSKYRLSWTASSSFSVYVRISGVMTKLSSGAIFDDVMWARVDPTSFILVANDNAPLGRDCKLSFEITQNGATIVDDSFKVSIPDDRNFSVTLDEATGSQYRKVALNGTPLADSKPQQEAESDGEPEETFVDALTLGLRHSTTDVYLPVPGSDLSLSARRDFTPEVWNERSGLRPQEDPQKPFGACWSSSLTPSIKFVTSGSNPRPNEPDKAYVIDESGATHPFFIFYGNFGTGVANEDRRIRFFPVPSAKNQQSPNLTSLIYESGSSGTLVFSRKFGTTIRFEFSGISQTLAPDRVSGAGEFPQNIYYGRATTVTDRLGNIVDYTYSSSLNLVPSVISVRNRPDLTLSIKQNAAGLITSVWDAKGNETKYSYIPKDYSVRANVSDIWLLDKVTSSDGSETHYEYDTVSEDDLTPVPDIEKSSQLPYWHCELKSVTDPLGHKHEFGYAFDHSRWNYKNDVDGTYAGHEGYYIQTGLPRNLSSVKLPSGESSTFQNNSQTWIGIDGNQVAYAYGQRRTTITDVSGFSRTYDFDQKTVVPIPQVRISYPDSRSFSSPLLVVYEKMTIQHGGFGSESFEFDLNAAMALKKVTDFCGNTTTFAHEDEWKTENGTNFRAALDATSSAYKFYSDPTSQTNALGRTKYFTYTPESRLMKSITDELGQYTEYLFDDVGRRTRETVYSPPPARAIIKDTGFFYKDSRFPGFMTSRISYAIPGSSDPAWVTNLVSEFTPDSNGRVAQEIVDPSGLRLVTKFTYDKNGNKLTATDPRGDTTWFSYDSRNRIYAVTHADGTETRTTYDTCGNKILVSDENGHVTGSQYDSMNRLVAQVRDMNGNLSCNSVNFSLTGVEPTDLITAFGYNSLGSKVSATDARGFITVMKYDELQRLTKTIQPKADRLPGYVPVEGADDVTSFIYDRARNCGGTVFDSAGFKPTSTLDPRGYLTGVTYNALYHPAAATAQYQLVPPAFSTTSTEYDLVENVKATVDGLLQRTETDYDGLYRPTVVRVAANTSESVYTQKSYTSTGFVWKQKDQEGRETLSQYDAAGRARLVTSPQVDRGDGTLASAVTESVYDPAGNPVATINPLGKRSDVIYDFRNRKIFGQQPAVFDQLSGQTVRPTTSQNYDGVGNVIKTTDAKGNVAQTLYDPANRATHIVSPAATVTLADNTATSLHTVSRMEYDHNSNVLKTTRGGIAPADMLSLNGPTPYSVALVETLVTADNTYDARNRLSTTKDAANITVANSYDFAGNLVSVKDGKNQTTRFTYDGFKRNTSIIDPSLQATTFEYDAVNKTARVDSNLQRTEYQYDALHRLKTVNYTNRSQDNRSYTYDKVGNLCAVTENKGNKTNIAYAYDALNRQIKESQGAAHAATLVPLTSAGTGALPTGVTGGLTHQYTYDLAGNRLKAVYGATNSTITSTYDDINRLKTMVEGSRTTSYSYDLNGGVSKLTQPNADTTEKFFDALGRTTTISTKSGGSTLSTYDQSFDLAGNCRKIVENYATGGLANRTVTNTYDPINRLTDEAVTGSAAVTTHYDYDNAHNRVAKIVTGQPPARTVYTNKLNQADYHYIDTNNNGVWDSGETKTTYVHDLNGNRTSATKSSGGSSTTDTYSYDYENRLTGIVKATPGTDLQTGTYAYTYDYRTRRVERNESAASGALTKLVFSGGTSVQEYDSGSSVPSVEFIRGSDYGGGVGGILYSLRGGNASFNHYNGRGDVVAKTDSAHALTFEASYEAYGKRTAVQGSTPDRQKANTKDEDPTGLLNEGMRYRDLDSGTFITRDPAGFVDGPNLYAYVRQNPWTSFDPKGLYAASGHFYTTYAVALAAGVPKDRAFALAYYSQIPDQVPRYDATKTEEAHLETSYGAMAGGAQMMPMAVPNVMADKGRKIRDDVQRGLHFLTGADEVGILRARVNLATAIATGEFRSSDWETGFAIHTLGDTFAHTQDDDGKEKGYNTGLGHLKDGHAPDEINHSAKSLEKYSEYVALLYVCLGGRGGAQQNKDIRDLLNTASGLPRPDGDFSSNDKSNDAMHEWFVRKYGKDFMNGFDPRKEDFTENTAGLKIPKEEEVDKHARSVEGIYDRGK